jgi:hypothetical protein
MAKQSTKERGHTFLPRPVFESTTLVFKQYKTVQFLCSGRLVNSQDYGLDSNGFKAVSVFEGTTQPLAKKDFGETMKSLLSVFQGNA